MPDDVWRRLNELLTALDRAPVWRRVRIAGVLAILLALGAAAWLIETAWFSPDSWAYFELAKSVFGGDFYAFNTWRSYFSEHYSVSFPFGLPVAIALVQTVFGAQPMAAVWLNVAVAAASWALMLGIGRRLGLSGLAALALATAMLMWPPYLNEVLAGRAIPLSLLWMLLAISAYQREQHLVGGLMLGLAALTRFDFLVGALLFIVGIVLLDAGARRRIGWWVLGMLLGMAPWIGYSLSHFGRFWASDNSWVATSVAQAYVVDYPARATSTVFDDPTAWLARVFGNVPELLSALAESLLAFPVLVALVIAVAWCWRTLPTGRLRRVGLALLIVAASVAPYLLTGYFDPRYFLPLLLAWSLSLAVLLMPVEGLEPSRVPHLLLTAALLISLADGALYVAKASWYSYGLKAEGRFDRHAGYLAALRECHVRQPSTTLIFARPLTEQASRYGATTGMLAAFAPSNLDRMSAVERQAYFTYMEPYLYVDADFDPHACPIAGTHNP